MLLANLMDSYHDLQAILRMEDSEIQREFWGQQGAHKDYEILNVPLTVALDDFKVSVEGYSAFAWLQNNIGSTSGISFKVNAKDNGAIPIDRLGLDSAVGFNHIYVTSAAQAGAVLQIFVGRRKGTRVTTAPSVGGGGSGNGGIINKGAWYHAHPVITAAGTAENLTAQPIPNGFKVQITNPPTNTGMIYLGSTKARAEAAAAVRDILDVGDGRALYINNLNLIWYDAEVTGEGPTIMVEA